MAQKELRRMLSKLGIASRSNADAYILAGRIAVNGRVVKDPMQPVSSNAQFFLDGQKVVAKTTFIYAFNKPQGVVTTMSETETRPKVADFLPGGYYLFPVGRLDKASRGLLLLTNDNLFADMLLAPKSKIVKIYQVQIKGVITEDHLAQIRQGMLIDGERYQVENVTLMKVNPHTSWLEFQLVEGKNREIRKILQALGYEVLDLIRIQIGKLKLASLNLKPGMSVLVTKEQIV